MAATGAAVMGALATAGSAVAEGVGAIGSGIVGGGLGEIAGGLGSIGAGIGAGADAAMKTFGAVGNAAPSDILGLFSKGASAAGNAIGAMGKDNAQAASTAEAAAAPDPMHNPDAMHSIAERQNGFVQPSASAEAAAYNKIGAAEHAKDGFKEGLSNGGILSGHFSFGDPVMNAGKGEMDINWGKSLAKWGGELGGKLVNDTGKALTLAGKTLDAAKVIYDTPRSRLRSEIPDVKLLQLQDNDIPATSAGREMLARMYAANK